MSFSDVVDSRFTGQVDSLPDIVDSVSGFVDIFVSDPQIYILPLYKFSIGKIKSQSSPHTILPSTILNVRNKSEFRYLIILRVWMPTYKIANVNDIFVTIAECQFHTEITIDFSRNNNYPILHRILNFVQIYKDLLEKHIILPKIS